MLIFRVYVNLVEGNWWQFAMEAMVHLVPSCVPIKNYQRLDFMFGSDLQSLPLISNTLPNDPPGSVLELSIHFGVPYSGDGITSQDSAPHLVHWQNLKSNIWFTGHEIEGFPILAMINFWADQSAMFCENVNPTQITIDCCLYQMYPLHLSGHRSKVTQTCLMMKFMYIDHCCSYHGMACKN